MRDCKRPHSLAPQDSLSSRLWSEHRNFGSPKRLPKSTRRSIARRRRRDGGSRRSRKSPDTMRARLILPSQNLNENTGLLHLAGIALAPSAKPKTNSKPLDVFFFGSNLFLGDGRLNKPPERQRVKAIRIRR